MASDFILQIICRIHQIRNPKRSLFRVKSQKNDTIGYATLIAPKIISGIKLRMYGSLFSAHVGRYCLENLHYCIFDCIRECHHECLRECCHEFFHLQSHGFSFSKPPCGYKRWGEAFAKSTKVQQPWLILGVLALALLKFVQSIPAKDTRRELVSDKKSLLPHPATPMLSLDLFWTSCPCIFQ